jgi:hypothetical protein
VLALCDIAFWTDSLAEDLNEFISEVFQIRDQHRKPRYRLETESPYFRSFRDSELSVRTCLRNFCDLFSQRLAQSREFHFDASPSVTTLPIQKLDSTFESDLSNLVDRLTPSSNYTLVGLQLQISNRNTFLCPLLFLPSYFSF